MSLLWEMEGRKAHFSIPSLIALVCAFISFNSGAFAGFLLAMAAIVFGVIGVLVSLAPGIRGGFVSVVSMAAGFLGILVAGIKAVQWLF